MLHYATIIGNLTKKEKKMKKIHLVIIAFIIAFSCIASSCALDAASNEPYGELKNASVGDVIEFGSYDQDNDASNGKEAIEWQVLEKDNNNLFIISKYALDVQPYNSELGTVTWDTCSLRSWLNETFFNEAFSESEQAIIKTTNLVAYTNTNSGTKLGEDTNDKVFLLSVDEVNKYFTSDEAKMCAPTAHAVANGADFYMMDSYKIDGVSACCWWLRTPGYHYRDAAATVLWDGTVYADDNLVCDIYVCVRPAMWICLDD